MIKDQVILNKNGSIDVIDFIKALLLKFFGLLIAFPLQFPNKSIYLSN